MTWLESLREIEELEDAEFDAGLVTEMERAAAQNQDRMTAGSDQPKPVWLHWKNDAVVALDVS